MHLDEARLRAVLDGELGEAETQAAHQHVAECAECRGALDELRRDDEWLHRVLNALDHPLPRPSAAELIARAGPPPARGSSWRWAAGVALLVVAAGTAYAIPGSPLRQWLDQALGRTPVERGRGPEVSSAAGVSLEPGARFSIVFPEPPWRGSGTIALIDGPAIAARRSGGDGAATFSVEIDRLVIRPGRGETDFTLGIPRSAPWVEVLVGGRRVFLKDGERIITAVPQDSLGRYRFSLTEGGQ